MHQESSHKPTLCQRWDEMQIPPNVSLLAILPDKVCHIKLAFAAIVIHVANLAKNVSLLPALVVDAANRPHAPCGIQHILREKYKLQMKNALLSYKYYKILNLALKSQRKLYRTLNQNLAYTLTHTHPVECNTYSWKSINNRWKLYIKLEYCARTRTHTQ